MKNFECKMFMVLVSCFLIISVTSSKRCKYGKIHTGKATYHNYTQTTSMNDVACQLPMAFNRRNKNPPYVSKTAAERQSRELRVTAVHKRHKDKNIMCGDCINVRNVDNGKSTVVMVIDFAENTELDLCPQAFQAIDSIVNKRGYNQGFITVDWYKTSCEDLIGNEAIQYRFKSGSTKNWFMGVSILRRAIPLARTNAVQISNHKSDPLSWFACKDNGATGYWFCTGHKPFNKNDPFYFKITSIDGQVLVDTIDIIGESDESNFIKSLKNLQFKVCHESYDTETSSASTITENPIISSWLCVLKKCNNCLWEYPNGIACYKDWTKSQCATLQEYGFHWCGGY